MGIRISSIKRLVLWGCSSKFQFHSFIYKIRMEKVSINQSIRLTPHFSLGEVTKSKHTEIYNIPSHVAIENLKRVCAWLEELRRRYNENYVLDQTTPNPS